MPTDWITNPELTYGFASKSPAYHYYVTYGTKVTTITIGDNRIQSQ